MYTTSSSIARLATLLCAGAALALPSTRLMAAGAPTEADAFPSYESYIKISGEAPFITGDGASFAANNGLSSNNGAYGIEDFAFSKDLDKDTSIKVNGHAMDGSEDYLGVVDLSNDNYGSLEAGYKRFRTFYDGVGGFFPLNNSFQRMSNENLHVDRGAFWFNLKMGKEDGPKFEISYHDEVRTGRKDSTEWAPEINPDATITKGVLVGTALPANTPYVLPNVMDLDEHHNILEGKVTDTIGNTTETFKATLDWVSNDDGRVYVKYPGSTVIADPTVTVQDDNETIQSRSYRLINQTETTLTNYLTLETGLSYLHMTGEDGGYWISPSYNATLKVVYPTVTATNIFATPEMDDYVGNIFLKFKPTPDWRVDVGFRDEYDAIADSGGYTAVSLSSTAKNTSSTYITTAQDTTYSHETDRVQTPEFTVEYLGIKNLTIYAEYDDRDNKGTQHWINPYAATSATGTVVTVTPTPIGDVFFQDANQDYKDAKLGANWNPLTVLTFRAELFEQDHQNQFIGATDYIGTGSYGTLYATGYTYTGVTLSMIYRPIPQLSFNTRFQDKGGDMTVTANAATNGQGNESPSGKTTIKMLSESVVITPYKQLYFQGNVNLVYNTIHTAYPEVTVNAANSIAVPFLNSDNNYTTATGVCGFAADKDTDIQLQVFWERANNYNPQVDLGGIPYGASFEISSETVGVKHKFNARILGEAKVGYIKDTCPTNGGFTNYNGPVAYLSLTYAL